MSEKVALVHERFTEMGGSEKVVEAMAGVWPHADLFAPVIDPTMVFGAVEKLPSSSTWLQRLYRDDGRYAHLLPLLPGAMKSIDLKGYGTAILSHHAFANRVRIPLETKSLSYVHTPARWLWDEKMRSSETNSNISRAGIGVYAATQRHADRAAAQRPDVLVANSTGVAQRINDWWDREAVVVHPPVDVQTFTYDDSIDREDFFLLAGRLVPYKRPELAIRAATRAGVRLVVAGAGRSTQTCENLAGPNVEFLGAVSDAELRDLFRRCAALVFPGIEDFGMVPVEAQACGAPVIGVGVGGLRDTVIQGQTGVLVPEGKTPEELVANLGEAMIEGQAFRLDHEKISGWAQRFSADRFATEIREVADRL